MYTGNGAPPHTTLVEQAGTLDFHSLNRQQVPDTNGAHARASGAHDSPRTPGASGEEQALEWHEVIELQAFSERKAWIEQKIRFLEQMPPIEVYAGMDAVRSSAEVLSGLPSRTELEQWQQEHDRIEKETELFDSGELKKLKKFTKAATQRNLSPADTDLIELTLTTIFEFDKLLHLLRDRSDNLELLSTRLTWEERRTSAWCELRSIISDLQQFLDTRGRWSPSIYDRAFTEEDEQPARPDTPKDYPSQVITPTVRRKGSMVSLASSTSDSMFPSLVLSRSERFKIAERLSRDAAQFSSRVASLKHNKINAAGKALDHLIDASRRPVPEELLDEQDKLEDEGINGMEDVGKFVMGVVMQWKKADEVYVETLKDKNAAQTLLEEIETAKMFHPTPRQASAFLARTTTLSKRLTMRGDPATIHLTFPQPSHPLFDRQFANNAEILDILTTELETTAGHVKRVDTAAKEYHATYEVVKKIETVCKAAEDASARLLSILGRFENGTESTAGDGSPPDLSAEGCLQSTSHSVFLSLLPSLLDEFQQADEEAVKVLQASRPALLDVGRPGIDPKFASASVATIDHLDEQRLACTKARDAMVARVATLKRVREIWAAMAEALEQLEEVRSDIADGMKMSRWQSQSEDAALLTPESPASILPPAERLPAEASSRLDVVNGRLQDEVVLPLDTVSSTLGPGLRDYLSSCSGGLQAALNDAKRMVTLWTSVRTQTEAVNAIREDAYALQLRSEDLKLRYDDAIQDVVSPKADEDKDSSVSTEALLSELQDLHSCVDKFQSELPRRTPFVARQENGTHLSHASAGVRKRFSVSGINLDIIQQASTSAPPLDLTNLDRVVRADVNSLSMALAGSLEGLKQKNELLKLALEAQGLDADLARSAEELRRASDAVSSLQEAVEGPGDVQLTLEELSTLAEKIDQIYPQHSPVILSHLSESRTLFDNLQGRLACHDSFVVRKILDPRREQQEALEQQFYVWKENVEVLSERVSDMRHLEQVRIAEAERQKREEEARLEAEREQARLEAQLEQERQERLEREERERAELEQREAEQRKKVDEEKAKAKAEVAQDDSLGDVFDAEPSSSAGPALPSYLGAVQSHVRALRRRLRATGIDEAAFADPRGTLPSAHRSETMDQQLCAIVSELEDLPTVSTEFPSLEDDLRSLRLEVDATSKSLNKVKELAHLAAAGQDCDNALSDLLEHVDSYPAPPAGPLASLYSPDFSNPPEEQMSSRLEYTRGLVDEIVHRSRGLGDDARAVTERVRIIRTWDELQAMALDRLNGRKSRPPSVMSSGRSSRASITSATSSSSYSTRAPVFPKHDALRNGGRFLAPPAPHTRRVTSAGPVPSHTRSSSRASVSTKRSVSGPVDLTPVASRLQTTTFASRQRSSSVTSTSSPLVPPSARKIASPPSALAPSAPIAISRPGRPRANTSQSHRGTSPAFSEASRSRSRAGLNTSQSSAQHSTWSRAPRASFPTLPMASPPRRRQHVDEHRPYVANPKNKLDVALGDVVNNLPGVNLNIEVVEDTWRDQSGKYWIGDEDPKLCFCRILRSETVMVRVGGGWTELSKFIKEHFADAFRVLPESSSPPRFSREEKWISSASLAQVVQSREQNATSPPRTPEPRSPTIPSFALSTPSPHSVASSSSPLRAIQFIRRADRDSPVFRAETPSRGRLGSLSNTPRPPAWRP